MLVLTRKCSEVLHIGEGIVIKVIRTGRNTVKLGIEAPTNVKVVRGELQATTLASLVEVRRQSLGKLTDVEAASA